LNEIQPDLGQMGYDSFFNAVDKVGGRLEAGVLFVCDHATNALPQSYDGLGLLSCELHRHIAYDIGAADLTRTLAKTFEAPALLAKFSRLLIDPNRGLDDPTLVMRISDGNLIPGNARIGNAEIEHRIDKYWRPYRLAIAQTLDAMLARGPVPIVFSIHSFTPSWKEARRPWEIAVLWDSDARLASPLIKALADHGFIVGNNEPYDGALIGDTLDEEVTRRGLPGLLIECRQDLIDTPEKILGFAERLIAALRSILSQPELHALGFFPSRTGRHI
jgi:predicted N-formylglutamate amidohydrolase